MRHLPAVTAITVCALGVIFGATGCTKYYDSVEYDGGYEDTSEYSQFIEEPTEERIRESMDSSWDCYYDPSMNNNWHDDVICRNGFDAFRPTLMAQFDFVTENDMIAAGEAFEVDLNEAESDSTGADDGPQIDPPSWVTESSVDPPSWVTDSSINEPSWVE